MDAPPTAATEPGRKRRLSWLACLLLLSLGAVAHVWFLIADCPFDLSGDEAYYWEWSRRLDVSYADTNGPLTAYLIAASRVVLADWSQRTVGSEALAVRLPAVGLSLLTAFGIYTLALSVLRRPMVALAAAALTFTIPILVVGSALMTIDAPLACAWIWAMVSFRRALERDETWAWVATGILIAVGVLAKNNMVLLLVAGGLLILLDRSLWRNLRRPGPYVAAAIGLAGFIPIVAWNARHDWVAFRQVVRQAGVGSESQFDPFGPLAFIGGQMAVVGPLWLVGMVWAMVDLWRRPVRPPAERHAGWEIKLVVAAAAVPWLVFLGFSPVTKVQPNWPVVSILSGSIILAAWLARHWYVPTQRRLVRGFTVAGVLLGAGLSVGMHRSEWFTPMLAWLARGSPPLGLTHAAAPWDLTPLARYDPSVRMRGWAKLGQAVGEVLRAERAAGREPFILAGDYQTASLIAFYAPGEPTVYSAQRILSGRRSQYDFWPNPIRDRQDFVGRPCIYVGSLHKQIDGNGGTARAALPGLRLARTVEYTLAGERLQIWSIFVCDAFAGFE